ncbi:hypothetical protein Pfo_018762 [Paulownia fortunei]|nr:hypothetical protein Pfo_018762 [Paulownia fortunei]
MRAFIKLIDEKAWKFVNEKRKVVLKPEDLWTTLDNELTSYNSKALNAIFSVVDSNQFWLIATLAYEGTTSVRLSKLMEDNETIADFNAKLCDIANKCHALGEKYDDTKLVRKTLRSLPDRFSHKVTAIEEAKDVTIMHLDELMCSLQTFKMNLKQNRRHKDKYKSASNSSSFSNNRKVKRIQCKECEGHGHIQSECANTLKKKKRKSLNITWKRDDVVNNRIALSAKQDTTIQSEKCYVISHVQTLVGTSRILEASTDTVSKGKEKVVQNFSTDKISDCSSDEEEPSDEDIRTMYRLMYKKCLEVCKTNKLLDEQIVDLTSSLSRINTGKAKLDEILSTGQVGENHQGIGYIGECSNTKMDLKLKIEFVKITVAKLSIFDFGKKKIFQKPRPKRYIAICHYCHISGHIHLKCFKLKNDLWNGKHVRTSFFGQFEHEPNSASKHTPKIKIQLTNDFPRKIWIKKYDLRCNVANISLKASTCESWYFDSGCSRHMTSNKSNLSNFQSIEKGRVTFEDGVSGQIVSKGTLDVKGLPRLKNVLLIEGLKTNLISIGQLCDQNLLVHFTKDLCQVFYDTNCCVMTGKMSEDNCYLLEHQMSCLNVIHDETEIWHQKLGHLNFKSLSKFVNTGALLGVPKLSKKKMVFVACVIETLTDEMRTRQKSKLNYRDMVRYVCYTSSIKPKNINEALKYEFWVNAMQEKLGQFVRNDVWTLVYKSSNLIMGFVSQSKYGRNLLKKFGLENTKHIRTPMGTNDRLSKDGVGTSLYRSIIGSLLYLTTSKLDICFSVGVCAKYMNGTSDHGIWYSKDTNSNLAGYCDTDWPSDVDDRKSTSGGYFFLSNNLISWFSKTKPCKRKQRGESSRARAKRGNLSGAAAGTSPTSKIPIEFVPLAIEYPLLEITFEPHKEAPIAKEEQVTEPVQGSSSFHTPATSLANTTEVVETLRDFNQGQQTDPIGEETQTVPDSVPQPTTRLSTSSNSVEFIVQQGSTSGNIHVSLSDNSSDESAQRDEMDVEDDRIKVSKVASHKFYSDYAKEMWECVSQRKLWSERSIRLNDFEDRGLDSILIDRYLIGSVTDIKPYVPQVVKEFYCNLYFDIIKADSGKFGHIYIMTVTNWTRTANHTVFVKDQAILLYLKTTTGHLPFPSLIYNVLVSQGFKKLRTEQMEYPRKKEVLHLIAQLKGSTSQAAAATEPLSLDSSGSATQASGPLAFLAKKGKSVAIARAEDVRTSGAGGVHAEPGVVATAKIGGETLDVDTQQAGEGQAEADKEA